MQRAKEALGENHVSVGWSFVYGNEQEEVPQYWFKLDDPTRGWNEIDKAVVELLSSSGCDITSLEYLSEKHLFQAQRYDRGWWSERRQLEEVLREILGSRTPLRKVRNYGYINRDAQRVAIDVIDAVFSHEELRQLSLSRTLTNCYIYPWFAKQPMDLDLCYSVDGKLYFVEFKRNPLAGTGIPDGPPRGLTRRRTRAPGFLRGRVSHLGRRLGHAGRGPQAAGDMWRRFPPVGHRHGPRLVRAVPPGPRSPLRTPQGGRRST